jgi:pSer/pThr/pTyr-binding forkhead associated (FHA) protein
MSQDWLVDAALLIFVAVMLVWFVVLFTVDRRKRFTFNPPATDNVSLLDFETLSARYPLSIFEERRIPIESLEQIDLPVDEIVYLAVGGGLGSFAWVDYLRVCGAQIDQIAVIGPSCIPYENYRRLCCNSQLFDEDRIRSDSGSTPDNVWGWPGYAVREAWQYLTQGQPGRALAIAWQIFAEPNLAEIYTPRSGDVFRSIDQEAARIGWEMMFRPGFSYRIRKTDDDRYAVLYAQPGQRPRVMLARYVHLATGYSGMHVLPDLRQYRERTGDTYRVVQAYEEHNHIYQQLVDNGGTVLIRGRGIVASQIIQRLYEARGENPDIKILHLMREPQIDRPRIGRAQRLVESHWQLQPFNWPKSAFGGQWQARLAQVEDSERAYFFDRLGGVTTANRRAWRTITNTGFREGWYQVYFGSVMRIEDEKQRLVVTVGDKTGQECATFAVHYIIDATGLESKLDQDVLLGDLYEQYAIDLNRQQRLSVNDAFEVQRMRNGAGRVFAAGIITAGGAYGPVDSFTGLLYAAQSSIDSLVVQGAPGLCELDAFRSALQWTRWCRGVQP